MRIFLIFNNHGAEMAPLIRALKKKGHEVVYWVGVANQAQTEFPEIIFHDCRDAQIGVGAKALASEQFLPIGEDIISQFYKTESELMTIFDKKMSHLHISERKHLYYQILGYWYHVIIKYKPDLIVFPTSPDNTYSHLVHNFADFLNIPMLMFSDTWLADRTVIHEKHSDPTGRRLKEVMIKNKNKNFTVNDLSEDVRQFYYLQTGKTKGDAQPAYEQKYKKNLSGPFWPFNKYKILAKSLKRGDLLNLIVSYPYKYFFKNLRKEYNQLAHTPDFTKKFIYVPLQYQPERSTSPLGGIYVDQPLMLETLSAVLPNGWVIYVKEHPHQWRNSGINYNAERPKDYYSKISRLKNVFIVLIKTNTYDLINNALAVVTVTGTPAWEAVFRGKPSVIFGYPWHRSCPLILKANNCASLKEALLKIKNGYLPDDQSLINYLKSFDEAAIHCLIDDFGGDKFGNEVSKLNFTDRMNNFIKVIIEELEYLRINNN